MLSNLAMSFVKLLASVIAGIGAGFLAIGIFALRHAERWEFTQINRKGPPFGPTIFAVGVGLLTTMVLLVVLFWRAWRRMSQQGSIVRGTLIKILACLVGGAGTGMIVMGAFALHDPERWEFDGPMRAPMGPILLAVGIGFLTTPLLMAILFWGSARRLPMVPMVTDAPFSKAANPHKEETSPPKELRSPAV